MQRMIYKSFIVSSFFLLMAQIVSSCVSEQSLKSPELSGDGIQFGAYIVGPDRPETRANNNTYNITTEFYNTNYFIREEGYDYDDELREGMSRYRIPSGYEATILPADSDEKTLNWFSRTGVHDFWCWTMPHDQEFDYKNSEKDIKLIFKDTHISEATSSSPSPSSFRADSWRNGIALDTLIGAHTGPLIYNDQGMYVPLRFRHLISRIILTKFYVVDNVQGTTDETLKGTITFYGMPSETILHTSPRDEEGNPMAPYISLPENWDYDPSKSVTYALCNYGLSLKWEGYDPHYYASTMPRDCWRIPPEIDFSKISFKIVLYEYNTISKEWEISQTHGKNGAYYGDFSNVKFSRSSNGSNYDNPDGGDNTILHAGEYLQLTINLYEKGNPVLHGNIIDWNAPSSDRQGSSYIEQGIYSCDELRDISAVMAGTDTELMEQYYELYGSGRTTESDSDEYPDYEELYGQELKIFELYDDIGSFEAYSSTSSSSTQANNCCMGDGYILDGRGHTINFNTSLPKIGPVRDVYFRYYYYSSSTPRVYYEYLIYIDKMSNVWQVDPETYEMTPTGTNALDPNYLSYYIYITSGNLWKPDSGKK